MSDNANAPRAEARIAYYIAPRRDSSSKPRTEALLGYITDVASEMGWQVSSEDQIYNPSAVVQQILRSIAQAHLLFADLTGGDPNVYYEVAVAHALGKPVVCLIETGEAAEFELSGQRTVPVKFTSNNTAVNPGRLKTHVRQILQNQTSMTSDDIVNPIQAAGIRLEVSPSSPASNSEATAAGSPFPLWPDASGPWTRAAQVGLLADLQEDDLEARGWVVHRELGLGRIEQIGRDPTGALVLLKVQFATGSSTELSVGDFRRDLRDLYPLRLNVSSGETGA